jgi:hypothetical protein
MNENRKRKPPPTLSIPFEEALARFVQTDPKEIADTYDQVRRDEEELDKHVAERERSIRAGARRAPKRFRL